MSTGGVKHLTGESLKAAEITLRKSLEKLAAGDGPTYSIVQIIEATSQVVAGSLYKYKVQLKGTTGAVKDCNVEIWARPWLENGIQVTIDCEGEEKVVKYHSA